MRLIRDKSGFKIGRDRISKICTGRLKNYTLETAVMISEALNIPVSVVFKAPPRRLLHSGSQFSLVNLAMDGIRLVGSLFPFDYLFD